MPRRRRGSLFLFTYSAARQFFAARSTCAPEFLRACLVLAVVSLPVPARAWGCEGHQVVALLAEKHLTPHALAMAKKILAEGPIDPSLNRYLQAGRSRRPGRRLHVAR